MKHISSGMEIASHAGLGQSPVSGESPVNWNWIVLVIYGE